MKRCFECETTEDLQEHHVVPRSKGGTKTITLCYQCHMKVHGRDGKSANHKRLTKEGLKKAKERGVQLGNPRWEESGDARAKARVQAADDYALSIAPIVEPLYKQLRSYGAVARTLNEQGIRGRRGGKFSPQSISNVIKRLKKLKAS